VAQSDFTHDVLLAKYTSLMTNNFSGYKIK